MPGWADTAATASDSDADLASVDGIEASVFIDEPIAAATHADEVVDGQLDVSSDVLGGGDNELLEALLTPNLRSRGGRSSRRMLPQSQVQEILRSRGMACGSTEVAVEDVGGRVATLVPIQASSHSHGSTDRLGLHRSNRCACFPRGRNGNGHIAGFDEWSSSRRQTN